MLVVADTSPLIILIKIGHVQVLPSIFGRILIPGAVARELAAEGHNDLVTAFITTPPPWLEIRSPKTVSIIPPLDSGESEAIHLAVETSASLLLIDESKGRRIATIRAIQITGTVGVLERAARAGLLDLENAFERIKQIDFWIPHHYLDDRLKAFRDAK